MSQLSILYGTAHLEEVNIDGHIIKVRPLTDMEYTKALSMAQRGVVWDHETGQAKTSDLSTFQLNAQESRAYAVSRGLCVDGEEVTPKECEKLPSKVSAKLYEVVMRISGGEAEDSSETFRMGNVDTGICS
jgi:hypothetical protein